MYCTSTCGSSAAIIIADGCKDQGEVSRVPVGRVLLSLGLLLEYKYEYSQALSFVAPLGIQIQVHHNARAGKTECDMIQMRQKHYLGEKKAKQLNTEVPFAARS